MHKVKESARIGIKGRVTILVIDKNGNLKNFVQRDNIILNNGLTMCVDLIGNLGTYNPLACVAIGDNDTAEAATQTDIQGSEIARVNSSEYSSMSVTNTLISVGTFTGISGTMKEAVLADTNAAKGSRTCFSRIVTGSVAITVTDTISVIWEHTFYRK